jgi:large conductance mechanosensitive channel
MLKGFRDFVLRGNVVDLAVAVVIGAAFSGVITAFTGKILQPFINAFGGGTGPGLGFRVRGNNDNTFVDIGAFVAALINFAIVAAVIYFFVVTPMHALLERRRRGVEPAPEAPPEDVALLREIRDLLREQRRA